MTLEQQGAYFNLLNRAWLNDPQGWLPDDDELLAGMSGLNERWTTVGTTVKRMFNVGSKGLFNERLLQEVEKQKIRKQQASEAGKASAKKRCKKRTTVQRPFNDRSTTVNPSSSSASASTEEQEGESNQTEFLAHWNSKVVPELQAKAMTPKRKKLFKVRMGDTYWAEHWQEAVTKLADSAFLAGENDRGWRADMTWFLQRPDALVNVLEGKYAGPNDYDKRYAANRRYVAEQQERRRREEGA